MGRKRADLYINGPSVAQVSSPSQSYQAIEEIDASGLIVLPGFVDSHVHLMEPGDATREDFPSGTRAALNSGVTTVIEHTHGWPVTSVAELEEKKRRLEGRAWTDYALAAHAWDDNLQEVRPLWEAGIAFFKVFTCATHGVPAMTSDRLLEFFQAVAELDARCLVHCEDDLLTASAEHRLKAAGRTDSGVISEWRSREAEHVAIGSVTLLARVTGAAITIAHVSSHEALSYIDRERKMGADVEAETCPQYLTLLEGEVLDEGALRKFTPPARARSRYEQNLMWAAINDGSIGIVSSDHAPSTIDQKHDGSIWDVHFGLPGLDTTSAVFIDAAARGRISFEVLTSRYAASPARRYGLASKGKIAVGFDADLVMVDPNATRVLSDDDVISKAGWTPYAGMEVRGQVVETVLRGQSIVKRGVISREVPPGIFVSGSGATAQ